MSICKVLILLVNEIPIRLFLSARRDLFLDPYSLATLLSTQTDVSKSHQLHANHDDCVAPAKLFRAMNIQMGLGRGGTQARVRRRLNTGSIDDRG